MGFFSKKKFNEFFVLVNVAFFLLVNYTFFFIF